MTRDTPPITRPLEALFRPFRLHDLTLRNRTVMAPMGRHFISNGVLSPDYIAYFRQRAEGGAGLLIGEGTGIDHPVSQTNPTYAAIDGEEASAIWRQIVDAVHGAGGHIFPQLYHAGMTRPAGTAPNPDAQSIGPSGLSFLDGGTPDVVQTAEPATQADIDSIVEGFASSAETAKRIGFDGIEIHGAHGYLLDQFFWEKTNRRTDGYGGDIVGRTRFAAEVIAECRRRVGPDYPISLRLSQWKMQDFDAKLAATPQELERFLEPLTLAGVDLFHCSERWIWLPAFEGSDLNLAGWTKKLTGKPTMAVGSVTLDAAPSGHDIPPGEIVKEPELPESLRWTLEMLDRGAFDLVTIGRGMIANADWTNKVQARQWTELRSFTPDMLATLE